MYGPGKCLHLSGLICVYLFVGLFMDADFCLCVCVCVCVWLFRVYVGICVPACLCVCLSDKIKFYLP